jgi:hypothetical protein
MTSPQAMEWSAWQIETAQPPLAGYVLPDRIAQSVRLTGNSADGWQDRLGGVWEALSELHGPTNAAL